LVIHLQVELAELVEAEAVAVALAEMAEMVKLAV
jgi:hypothetical protein